MLELRKSYQVLRGSSEGLSAVEVIIALGVLGIIAAALLSGLATTLNATRIAGEHSNAQSLAQSQMEYVKSRGYSTGPWSYAVSSSDRSSSDPPSWWDAENPPFLFSQYGGYSVVVKAENFDADDDDIVEVPGDDEDIRTITVTVEHGGEEVFTLEAYKVNR